MKTDDLIRALTKDLADPGPSIEARFAAAFMPGVLVGGDPVRGHARSAAGLHGGDR